jgi:hypothetical protein
MPITKVRLRCASCNDIQNNSLKLSDKFCGEAHSDWINPLTPELNSSAQRCLTKFFIGDFAY